MQNAYTTMHFSRRSRPVLSSRFVSKAKSMSYFVVATLGGERWLNTPVSCNQPLVYIYLHSSEGHRKTFEESYSVKPADACINKFNLTVLKYRRRKLRWTLNGLCDNCLQFLPKHKRILKSVFLKINYTKKYLFHRWIYHHC